MLPQNPPLARDSARFVRRLCWVLCLTLIGLAWSEPAHAYPWMIRHGYTQCGQCHLDPSGSGALTAYGHALSEVVLRTHYKWEQTDDDGKAGKFLFGAVELPDELDFGGDLRALSLHTKSAQTPLQAQLIWMQLEGKVSVQAGHVVGSATLGYSPKGALGAAITGKPDSNLVSREHWLGVWLAGSQILLRAGRMNVPFGIRSLEHTLWARSFTGTDINDAQQYGIAVSYVGDQLRAEVMGIAGSLQIRPDVFRQRGYSAYAEYVPARRLALGASSRIVHLELDPRLLKEEWKHAHGIFGRWGTPWEPLVLLTEWDYVFESPKYFARRQGIVGYLQADIEATQGVHFLATGEASNVARGGAPPSWGGWLSYAWFFAPHADIRLDNVFQSFASSSGRVSALSFLIQAHLSL